MADVLDFEVRMKMAEEDIQRMNSQLRAIANNAKQAGNQMDETFGKVGKTIGTVFATTQLVNFAKQVVNVRKEIESYEISFRTLLGSQEKADALFGSLREFAVKTPMQLGDLAKGAQTLLGFGIEADKIMPTLKQIGDISMGNADKFGSLTLAFAQMSSTGKLMGQDLLQMINAGFNPLAIIAEQTGKSIGDLKKDMEQGAISTEMVADAFKTATSEGGMFYGMLEKQSEGLQGALSNLQGAWEEALNGIGERTQDIMVTGLKGATKLVENFDSLISVILGVASAFGTYKAVLISMNIVSAIKKFNDLRNTLTALKAAQEALNTTALKNPYVLLASAIIGVGVALYSYATRATAAERAQEGLNSAMKKYQDTLEENRTTAKSALDTLRDENTTNKQKYDAYVKLGELVPELTEKYSQEALAIMDVVDATRLLNEEIEKQGILSLKDKRNALSTEGKRAHREGTRINEDNIPEEYRSLFNKYQSRDEQKDILNGIIRGLDEEIRAEELASLSLNDQITRTQNDIEQKENLLKSIEKTIKELETKPIEQQSKKQRDARAERLKTAKEVYDYNAGLVVKYKKELNDLTAQQQAQEPVPIQNINEEIKKTQEEIKKTKKELADLRSGKTESIDILGDIEKKEKDLDDLNKKLETLRGKTEKPTTFAQDAAEEAQRMEDDNYRSRLQYETELAKVRTNNLEEYYNKQQEVIDNEYDLKVIAIEKERDLALKNAKVEDKDAINTAFNKQISTADASWQLDTEKNNQQREAAIYWQRLETYRQFAEEYMRIEQERVEREAQINKLAQEGKITQDEANQRLETSTNVALVEKTTLQAEMGLTAEEVSSIIGEVISSTVLMSIDQIRSELPALEAELKALKEAGADPAKIANLTRQIAIMKNELQRAKKGVTEVNEETTDGAKESKGDWKIVSQALGTVNDAISEVSNAFGDMFGEAGEIAIEVMQTTLNATMGVLSAVTATSEGASASIKAAESASVILAIISAAAQVIMAITNAIMKNFSAQAMYEKSMEEYNVQLDEIDAKWKRIEFENSKKSGVDYWMALADSASQYSEKLSNLNSQLEETKKRQEDINKRQKYDAAARNSFGLKSEAELEKEAEEKRTKTEKELEQTESEIEAAILEEEKALYELQQQILEEMATTNVEQFGETMAESIVEGFSNGMEGMKTNFDDTVNDLIKSMLTKRLALQLTDQFKDAFAQLESATLEDTAGGAMITDSEMASFLANIDSAKTGAMAIGEEYQKLFAEMGLLDDEINAESKGFETMSQDTADELNGRFTALQISGANIEYKLGEQITIDKQALLLSQQIGENVELATQIAQNQLNELRQISKNTQLLEDTNRELKLIKEYTSRL